MRILVTGATGGVGRQVVDELTRRRTPDVQIRALTVDPDRAALPAEVEVARGFLGRPDTLPAALRDVDRVYLAPMPTTVEEVVSLAATCGVERIVDLSGEKDSWWASVANAVEASGLDWTHLCPGEFMSNTTIWSEQIRTTGVVRDCDPEVTNAPIDVADVAAVAAVTLLEAGHGGREYTMTGPEALSRLDLVRRIGEALGKEVPYVEVSREEAIAELEPAMGEYAAWYVDSRVEQIGHPQQPVSTVEDLLGRPATTFAEWALRHADEFR